MPARYRTEGYPVAASPLDAVEGLGDLISAEVHYTAKSKPAISQISPPKGPTASSGSGLRHCVIRFGCASNGCRRSTIAFAPPAAARAIFASKAGAWLRRDRVLVFFPVPDIMSPSDRSSTYPHGLASIHTA